MLVAAIVLLVVWLFIAIPTAILIGNMIRGSRQ